MRSFFIISRVLLISSILSTPCFANSDEKYSMHIDFSVLKNSKIEQVTASKKHNKKSEKQHKAKDKHLRTKQKNTAPLSPKKEEIISYETTSSAYKKDSMPEISITTKAEETKPAVTPITPVEQPKAPSITEAKILTPEIKKPEEPDIINNKAAHEEPEQPIDTKTPSSEPKKTNQETRPLSKFASAKEIKGETEGKTVVYKDAHEDLSTPSTHNLPAELEPQNRSNIKPEENKLISDKTNPIDNKIESNKQEAIDKESKAAEKKSEESSVTTPNNPATLLGYIEFDKGAVDLTPEIEKKILPLIEKSKKSNNIRIRIVGYSSAEQDISQPGSSRRIALQRVVAVRKYMISNNIDHLKITVQAIGESLDKTKPDNRVEVFVE